MSFKDDIKAKITSRVELDRILRAASTDNRVPNTEREEILYWSPDAYREGNLPIARSAAVIQRLGRPPLRMLEGGTMATVHHTRWWLVRELLRTYAGVYYLPEVMEPMWYSFPELAIHTKPDFEEDPLAVWFTPDPQSGERDQQVRTTLGRLARKLYPHVPDDQIRDFEASFRAEMSNELEILPAEQIPEVYPTLSATSCMTHEASRFALKTVGSTEFVHPTAAYVAPGFGLAVVRKDNRIVGRSLVWVNPNKPEDKRYIRVYGDGALSRRLQRHGYRPAGLAGAVLRHVPIRESNGAITDPKNTVLMPYIDSVFTECAVRGAVWCKDGVMLVDQETASMLAQRGIRVGAVSGGAVALDRKAAIEALNAKCPVTGEMFAPNQVGGYVFVKGEVQVASLDGYKQIGESETPWVLAYGFDANGTTRALLAEPGTQTLAFAANTYVDCDSTRERLGFVRLEESLYPGAPWELSAKITYLRHRLDVPGFENDRHRVVRRADVVHYVPESMPEELSRTKYLALHKSEVPKGSKVLHRIDSEFPCYAHPKAPIVKTATSSRSVVLGVHSVLQVWDGTVDFTRNLRTDIVRGVDVVHRRDSRIDTEAIEDYVSRRGMELWNASIARYLPLDDVMELEGRLLATRVTRIFNQCAAIFDRVIITRNEGKPVSVYLSYTSASEFARFMEAIEVARRCASPEFLREWVVAADAEGIWAPRGMLTQVTSQNQYLSVLGDKLDELEQIRNEVRSAAAAAVESTESGDEFLLAA